MSRLKNTFLHLSVIRKFAVLTVKAVWRHGTHPLHGGITEAINLALGISPSIYTQHVTLGMEGKMPLVLPSTPFTSACGVCWYVCLGELCIVMASAPEMVPPIRYHSEIGCRDLELHFGLHNVLMLYKTILFSVRDLEGMQ